MVSFNKHFLPSDAISPLFRVLKLFYHHRRFLFRVPMLSARRVLCRLLSRTRSLPFTHGQILVAAQPAGRVFSGRVLCGYFVVCLDTFCGNILTSASFRCVSLFCVSLPASSALRQIRWVILIFVDP